MAIKCVNENCNNNPFDNELKMALATPGADYACCNECLEEFKKQRDKFFDNILGIKIGWDFNEL